jgi:hypothetical protein
MTTDNDTPKTVDQLTSTESLQASETEMPEAPAAPTEDMPQAEATETTPVFRSPALRYMAIGGAVCTLLAWAFLVFSEWASMSFDVVAIVLSAIGCRLRPGNMRNLAITSVIAAGTLALVFVTLFVGLHILETL